jgi:2-amino-4-hydroxy-6-hydroxymethyldihydropteridine diphosphokinase
MAMELLSAHFPSIEYSRVFESEAVGFEGANFLNLVGRFSSLDVERSLVASVNLEKDSGDKIEQSKLVAILAQQLKQIEDDIGRVRGSEKFAARNIDIDILLFGELKSEQPVQLPRGEILENAYVLWPLSELSPNLTLPGLNTTYTECWQRFDQDSQVIKPVDFR